jgi:hypothetical protein
VFEAARTAMTVEGHAEVVRSNGHPEFVCQVLQNIVSAGAFAVRSHGLKACIAQRETIRLVTPHSALCIRCCCRACRGFFRLFSDARSSEPFESTFGDVQLPQLSAQFRPFCIETHEPL